MTNAETVETNKPFGLSIDRIGLTLLFAVLLVAPLIMSNAYQLNVLVLMVVNAILAIGLAIVIRAGRLSLAQASFGGIGGYTSGYLTTKLGVDFWMALPVGAMLAAFIGICLGLVSLRLRGFYFAIATFTFSQLAIVILRAWTPVTGGMSGMFGLPHPTGFFGLEFSNAQHYYYLVLAALLIVVGIYFACSVSTSFGRGLTVLGEDEVLATTLGVPATQYRLIAFSISSAIGAVGGSFGAHFIQGVSPSDIAPIVSVFIVVMVLAGGARTIVGPIIGAMILTLVPELLRASAQWSMVLYGVFLLLYVYLFRDGLLPIIKLVAHRMVSPSDIPDGSLHSVGELRDGNASQPDRSLSTTLDQPVIRLESAVCRFGSLTVLEDLNWSVRNGCVNGIIGPNGAGKTTFFNMLTGVVPIAEGQAYWHGNAVSPVPGKMVRLGLGRTFQQARVFENHTVADSILLAAELSKRSVSKSHLRWIVGILELEQAQSKLGRHLTHYERRLTSIGLALASNPELLLLDEPLAGLDDTETRRLSAIIAKIQNQTGNTVLLIEHKLSEVMELCETLTVLDHGQIIARGTPKEVSQNPVVVEAYLGNE